MKLYCDGARTRVCFILEGQDPKIINFDEQHTNNEAEYLAIIEGLQEANKQGLADIEVYSDSQLVINQINARLKRINIQPGTIGYKTKERRLYNLGTAAIVLGKKLNATYQWVPREESPAGLVLDNLCRIEKKERRKDGRNNMGS